VFANFPEVLAVGLNQTLAKIGLAIKDHYIVITDQM
jgi:hypothetical protein